MRERERERGREGGRETVKDTIEEEREMDDGKLGENCRFQSVRILPVSDPLLPDVWRVVHLRRSEQPDFSSC